MKVETTIITTWALRYGDGTYFVSKEFDSKERTINSTQYFTTGGTPVKVKIEEIE